MASVVADTHAVLWYIFADPRISQTARDTLCATTAAGDPILVPAGFETAPLDTAVAIALRRIPRDIVPELADRVIAATALALGLPLVTVDWRIRAAPLQTIW